LRPARPAMTIRINSIQGGDAMAKTTHGCTYHRLYFVWHSMMRRCYNPQHQHFTSYGGRGIKVCKRWHDIRAFIVDMDSSYTPGLSLDRINNNRGYTLKNCRWATRTEQGRNKRSNRVITIGEVSQPLSAWREHYNISKGAIQKRVRRGLTIEAALSTPVDHRFRRSNHARV
jgi:hypothetical protein